MGQCWHSRPHTPCSLNAALSGRKAPNSRTVRAISCLVTWTFLQFPFWVGHSGALLMFLSSTYIQSKAFSGKILHLKKIQAMCKAFSGKILYLKKIQEVHKCIYTWTPSSPATTSHTDQYRATSFTWKLIWEYTSPTSASSIFLSRLPRKSAICTIIIHIASMSTQWRDSLSALEMPPRK